VVRFLRELCSANCDVYFNSISVLLTYATSAATITIGFIFGLATLLVCPSLASKGISKEFKEWIAIAKDWPKWKQQTHSKPNPPHA